MWDTGFWSRRREAKEARATFVLMLLTATVLVGVVAAYGAREAPTPVSLPTPVPETPTLTPVLATSTLTAVPVT